MNNAAARLVLSIATSMWETQESPRTRVEFWAALGADDLITWSLQQ